MRKTLLSLLLCLALLVPSLLHFVQTSSAFADGRFNDLPLFTQAAVRHYRGEPVYVRADDLQDRYKPGAMVFKFPPPYLFFYLPWFDASGQWPTHFSGVFVAADGVIFAVALLLSCALVMRASVASGQTIVQPALFFSAVLALAAFFMPYWHVLGATSAENFILMATVLAYAAMWRWPVVSGALLAWLACMKLYPAFLLVYPLVMRQWRVLAAAAATVVFVAILSWWIYGGEENIFYLTKVLPILLSEPVSEDWTETFRHPTGNLGIVKVLVSYELLPNRNAEWLNAVRLPFVAAFLWLLWRVARAADASSWQRLLAFVLAMVTMMICLPNFFFPYLTVMVFPMVVLAGFLVQRRQWLWLLLLAVPLSTLWLDDAWTVALAKSGGLIEPSAAIGETVARMGVWPYLWHEHNALWWCMVGGRVVPFTPYVLWFALAICLTSALAGFSRGRTPA